MFVVVVLTFKGLLNGSLESIQYGKDNVSKNIYNFNLIGKKQNNCDNLLALNFHTSSSLSFHCKYSTEILSKTHMECSEGIV